MCGSQAEVPTIRDIDTQVRDVAFAIAEAFAEVSINCRASGNADVRATGYALAEARAEALGMAVTEIFASADVCDMCSATVSAISSTSMELIAVAVAEAWTEVWTLVACRGASWLLPSHGYHIRLRVASQSSQSGVTVRCTASTRRLMREHSIASVSLCVARCKDQAAPRRVPVALLT